MSAAFTPGPWSVDTDLDVSIDCEDEDNGQVATGWLTITSDEYAGFAAIVVDMNSPNQWDDEQMEANGHLIRAAPNMFNALVKARDQFLFYERSHLAKYSERDLDLVRKGIVDVPLGRDAYDKALVNAEMAAMCDAALALARGEQP